MNISLQLIYFSHFNLELPDNTATKLQTICDQSQIWIQCNKCTKFIERLTNKLRIWTFHCNCPYISHLNEELPDNTATKLQTICDQSQIWIQCNKCTKFIERLTKTLRIWTFHCKCPYISHFNIELPDNTATKLQTICDQSQIWIQCNKCTKFIERLTNTLRIWTFHCNCPYISHLNEELTDNTATKLQMNYDHQEIWFSAIHAPNLLSVWQIHFEFEHFTATVLISVISMKNYLISKQTKLQIKCDLSQIWIQCNKCTKFIERLTNTLRIWTFHWNCPYFSHLNIELLDNTATKLQTICDQSQIWIQCNKCTKFIERLTNTLRIWTFHCNCPYISHLNEELPDNTATKLQMNYDHPEIWFSSIHAPNLLSVWQIHFEFEHFIANVLISVISKKNYQISKQTKLQIKCDQSQIWIQCNKCTKFTERLTNTLRIWTFHCNCPYISHLNIELPDNTATKLQTNCDQSQIWIQCNKCTKFTERLTNTLRIWTFHCNWSISVILI